MTGISGKRIIPIGKDTIPPENAPKFGEVGEWKDKLVARNPGWNDVLAKAQKAPGSRVKKI